MLALLGSLATVYGTLRRAAAARDGQQADAMAMNRTLAEKGEALLIGGVSSSWPTWRRWVK